MRWRSLGVLVGFRSPRAGREELAPAIFGEVPDSLSHEIGTIGLFERENATVFNAALGGLAEHVADAFGAALGGHGLDPAKYIAQNDGTLIALNTRSLTPC